MKIFDISMTIETGMPVFKGKASKRPEIGQDLVNSGPTVYETRMCLNLHTGTHLDAPLHMLPGGATIEMLPLERVVTRCKVLDVRGAAGSDRISADDLVGRGIAAGDFILLKTRNSFEDILEGEFVFVDQAGAQFLLDQGISGVGIDGLGIERAQPGHETHEILLGNDIIVLEGLRLADVAEGSYLLVAAPLKLVGTEAAPVRAILIAE
jgi:arylformamidase